MIELIVKSVELGVRGNAGRSRAHPQLFALTPRREARRLRRGREAILKRD